MISSESIDKTLKESRAAKNTTEVVAYQRVLQKKLKDAKTIHAEYLTYNQKPEPLLMREKIALARAKEQMKSIEDLNLCIQKIEAHLQLLHNKLTKTVSSNVTLSRGDKKPDKNRDSSSIVSQIISEFEVKVKNETVLANKILPDPPKSAISTAKPIKQNPIRMPILPQTSKLHENIAASDLRNGFLLTDLEIAAVRQAIMQAKTQSIAIVKFKRTRGKQGDAYSKLSEIEKTLGLQYSVLVIPPTPDSEKELLIALYKGKAQALGAGEHGTVKLGQRLDTGEWVAVKIERVDRNLFDDTTKKTEQEIQVTKKLGFHHGELTRKNLADVTNDQSLDKRYTVQTLLKGRSLEYYLKPDQGSRHQRGDKMIVDLGEKLDICLSTLENLKQLHRNGILHRDLHPGNILYDHTTKNTAIIDFGASAELVGDQTQVISDHPLGLYDHNRIELTLPQAKEYVAQHGTLKGLKLDFPYSKRTDINQMGATIGDIISNYSDPDILNAIPEEIYNPLERIISAMTNQNSDESVPSIDKCILDIQQVKEAYNTIYKPEHPILS